ncbi:hypothetical protein DFH07DRAFT_785883 [Mycena maculata]|uniref:Uncharacterized protein n=1 Tax=Mycena maculata TaxID=230809 RepID=A0AAD7H797_9AGAR|nr:hypothetical protein DFH07DRAFT_785883 [Mycena maculata]
MDIRARPFIIQCITQDHPRPVFRAQYRCQGNYSDLAPSDSDGHSTDSSDAHSEPLEKASVPAPEASDSNSDAGPGTKYKRRHCPQSVVLHIEVYSNDLSKAIIYQRNEHWEAAKEHLGMSQYIRQCIMEYASLANMTSGRIKRKDHPEKIFGFCDVDMSTKPPSKFATGIKSVHALQSILLWAFANGIGLDSCWRHKNENRAPVTFMTTIDQNNWMLTGPVYISANVTADTLEVYLREVKSLVEDMAEDLLTGTVEVHPSHARFAKKLISAAHHVQDNNWNWVPLFIMIDKLKAESKAISAGHSLMGLRQRHEHGLGDRWQPSNVTLVLLQMQVLQQQSFSTLNVIGLHHSGEINLSPDSWTDIGLPDGQNRDTISTNNWTERAFKTFDQIFLENRANKSQKIDRRAFKIAERGHRLWNSGGAIIEMPRDYSGTRTWQVAIFRAMVKSAEK